MRHCAILPTFRGQTAGRGKELMLRFVELFLHKKLVIMKLSFTTRITLALLSCFFLFKSSVTLASARPEKLIYSNANQTLVLNIFLNRHNASYLTKYELRDKNNKLLNSGQFTGCTYGGIINNISEYLKERKFVEATAIKNGFAIHSLAGCGGEVFWQLNVVTPICTASAPASNENGEAIKIGNDPGKIAFGYIKGVGAAREVTSDFFTLSDDGHIYHSQKNASVKLQCKSS